MGSPAWLNKQVEQYDRLPMYRSYRGLASILLGVFAILMVLSIVTKQIDINSLLDVVILLVLMMFVYLGSSLAIAITMIYWTVARAFGISIVLRGKDINEITIIQIVVIVIFWCLYIFILYRALRVAIRRNRMIHGGAEPLQDGHYCMKCGHVLPNEALFCPQCGCEQKHHIDTVRSKKHSYVITTDDGSQYVIDLKKRRHAESILVKGRSAYDPRIGEEVDIAALSRTMRGHRLHFVFSLLSVILLAVFLVVHFFDLSFKPKEYDARSLASKFNDAVVLVQSDNSFGSGVIISSDGLILTNKHVVAGGGSFRVKLHDGRYFPVMSVIPHDQYDLAVISIPATGLKPIDIKCQPRHDVGQKVVSIGNPGIGPIPLEHTVTEGIISGFRASGDKYLIQFDAAVSHGSSGGLLINSFGEAIGVPTAGVADAQNLNFAIPIEYAQEFLSGGEECAKRVEVTGQKLDYGMAERNYQGNIRILANTISDMLQEGRAKPKFIVAGVVVDDSLFPDLLVLRGRSNWTGKGRYSATVCEQQDAAIAVFNAKFTGLQRPYYRGTHCCYDVYTGFKNNYGYVVPIYMLGDCIDEKMHAKLKEALTANVAALMGVAHAKGLVALSEADFPESQAVVLRYYGAIRNREPALSLDYIIPEKRNRGAFTVANYEKYAQKISEGPQVYELFSDDKGGIFVLVSEKTYGEPESINLVRLTTEYKAGSWYIAKIVPVSVVQR